MRRRNTEDPKARECVEQATRIVIENALAKGWKQWVEPYAATGHSQAQSIELAANAAVFEALKNLVASDITRNQKASLRAASQALQERRMRYLPKNERRLVEKFKEGWAGRSVLELVRLPRQGNQNARLKPGHNRSKQKPPTGHR